MPNALFDHYLQTLKPAELKVLLVIIRQTAGYIAINGKRKTADWISGKRFRQLTGFTNKSISKAITSLLQKNLIQVTDQYAKSTTTSFSRRGKTKLYYQLSYPQWKKLHKKSSPHEKKLHPGSEKNDAVQAKKLPITKEKPKRKLYKR